MRETKRRGALYGTAIVLGGALLFAGFGITLPPDPSVRLNGATILAQAGDYDQALQICEEVLAHYPDHLDTHVFRATFLAMAGRHDEALAAYDAALERVGGDDDLRRDLLQDRAGVLLDAGRDGEFRAARDALAAEQPGHRVHVLDGLAAAKREDWTAAVKAYGAAHEARPNDDRIRARLWNALMDEGRAAMAGRSFAGAEASFDRAMALFPKATDAHLNAMEVRLARGDATGVIAIAQAAGRETPGIAPLVFRAATALLAGGDETGALAALEGAFEADAAGTAALFRREAAWQPYAEQESVRGWLETDTQKTPGRLTGSE